jgi:hypothetical protein
MSNNPIKFPSYESSNEDDLSCPSEEDVSSNDWRAFDYSPSWSSEKEDPEEDEDEEEEEEEKKKKEEDDDDNDNDSNSDVDSPPPKKARRACSSRSNREDHI